MEKVFQGQSRAGAARGSETGGELGFLWRSKTSRDCKTFSERQTSRNPEEEEKES